MTADLLSGNHFEIFGLPARFALDQEQLAERYRELQRAVHPDRYANAGAQERRLAVQRAAQINEAFQVLRDPLARAKYLLELHGVQVDDGQNTAMDPVFLMEQMELREALSEVRGHAEPQAALARLFQDISARIQDLTALLGGELDRATPDALRQARDNVRKLQFLGRLREEALELEADLEEGLG
ncbi:MAG: co-chaperone HscB [Gammaproteobacteria bacterium]